MNKEAAETPVQMPPKILSGAWLYQVAGASLTDTRCVQRVMTWLTTTSQWLLFIKLKL